MLIESKNLSLDDLRSLLSISESHFIDLKAAQIAPSKLTKTISAFANTGGGEIYIGIEEKETANEKIRCWNGFVDQEAANSIFQVLGSRDKVLRTT